jgi:hypothetical protein
MSEILANIVVDQTNINFSPDTNNLNITPEAIQLNIFTGASPGAGQSSNGELLYNNTNLIDGVPFTSYANGVLTLGSPANISITGGTNGYVLQTDGAGNLDWTAMSGGGGNGSPGGSNTQIQYNDNGLFGGASGFTFNEVSGNVAIPGALTVTGTIGGTLSTAAQPNITSVGTLTSFSVSGNISAGNANLGNLATANFFAGTLTTNAQPNITSVGTLSNLDVSGNITAANITANTGIFTGNAAGLTNIPGANVTGQVGNALIAGTVYTNAQPNITSVGTLTSLAVTGNISAGNVSATTFTGALSGAATTAGTVTTNAQPNITSVGTLSGLNITGNLLIIGTTTLQQAQEKIIVSGAPSGVTNFDLLDSAIILTNTAPTGNFTLNFRGNSTTTLNTVMSNNQSMTCTYINTTGLIPYFPTQLQIDSANITPIWSGNTGGPTPGVQNGKDMYTFNIMKTAANTYSVFASRTGFI